MESNRRPSVQWSCLVKSFELMQVHALLNGQLRLAISAALRHQQTHTSVGEIKRFSPVSRKRVNADTSSLALARMSAPS